MRASIAGWSRLICNLLVRPVAAKWHMSEPELEVARRVAHETAAPCMPVTGSGPVGGAIAVPLAWCVVAIPLAWGVRITLQNAAARFN